ncbi:hypothetical protein BS329_19540 [Amycolatopsis coloradensis]|uniref:EamA-like transporter family protein n=2 Tax=Amycolatopsis coloradensis TaxID=76021 RepID=A0A1R0KS14_9PSEU|nr:hypothetical protein BS329_19540 [Amycolatopsis coloradensis]
MGAGAAVATGAGLALQSRLTGELGTRLGDGVTASLISTSIGMFLLLTLVPALPAGRRGTRMLFSALRNGGLRPWHCAGGVCGALFVAGQGISVGALGVAVFTVAVVGGTAVGSLAVDHRGLGPAGHQPITAVRVGCAMACVAAVALAGFDRMSGAVSPVLLLLPVLAGAGIALQSAVNGRVAAATGSPWPATLLNFVVAAITLSVVLLVELALGGGPAGALPAEPRLYLAGLLGVAAITVATLVVRYLGVLVFGLAGVAGQLLGAVVIDLVAPGPRPTALTWIGAALTLAAVMLVARSGAVTRSGRG